MTIHRPRLRALLLATGAAGLLATSIGSDAFWHELDHTHRIGARTPPTSFVSGWYDFMIDQLLRDYEALTDAGRPTRLTIGPWWHVSPELQYEGVRDTLSWMNAELKADRSGLRDKPVRLFIGGHDQWREFDAYPPGVPESQVWHLHPEKVLSQRPVKTSPPSASRRTMPCRSTATTGRLRCQGQTRRAGGPKT